MAERPGRIYLTAVVAGCVLVCLLVLGLRWARLGEGAAAREASSASAASAQSALQHSSAKAHKSQTEHARISPNRDSKTPKAQEGGQQHETGAEDPSAPKKPSGSTKKHSSHTTKVDPLAGLKLPLELNHCSQAELEALPGIGPVLAGRIISYRNEHGPFASIEGLDGVKGIGPKSLERLRQYFYLAPQR